MLGSLTQQQIDEVLFRNVTGRIGYHNGERVCIVPVSYAYNGEHVIAHSKEGTKITMMRKNPNVCFEVDEMTDMSNWSSVIAWGFYEEITAEKERYYAMKFLVSRLMHLTISETARIPHMEGRDTAEVYKPEVIRTIVFRINIEEKKGKFERTIL
ncbi:pyridoxamine 5'-phosphate oxidase family protein [Chitinophaga oryziterrae]|uniref:Pyridoxamine 5'-phosphate oxidase family protein n=1 Tax=Chitinophaga oryziterrae TaxID=1031224 RepID=A0A6N8JFB2_9BACT|nr:pyridoxamine 5'-phosphate oxidase family protein [Chitinophaga oryziterrae]MVT43018.1 pyridoxamine 5'-phosphate oxidase family protein [Chitinophaga oryziterrae]